MSSRARVARQTFIRSAQLGMARALISRSFCSCRKGRTVLVRLFWPARDREAGVAGKHRPDLAWLRTWAVMVPYTVTGCLDPTNRRSATVSTTTNCCLTLCQQFYGSLNLRDEHCGYQVGHSNADLSFDTRDNAHDMRSAWWWTPVLTGMRPPSRNPWNRTVIYETHIRGFTIRHEGYPTIYVVPSLEWLTRKSSNTCKRWASPPSN